MRHKSVGLFLGLFLVSFAVAHAGDYSANWNGVRITPYAGVSEIYDDNVTFSSQNEIDDLITSLDAGLTAFYETHLSRFWLGGGLHHELFADNSDFDNTWGDISLDWRQEISRYDRIRLENYYVHADEPRTFEDAFNRTTGRFTYQRNRFKFGYEHDYSSQWTSRLRYQNEFIWFQENAFDDSQMHTFGGGALYRQTEQTQWMADYDFKYREFDLGGDATVHRFSGGLRQYLNKLLYADLKGGVDLIDTYGGNDLTEPFFEARLTQEFNETTSGDIAFTQEHALNSWTEDVFDEWRFSASLRRQFTKRLSGSLAAFYGEGEYDSLNREDKLTGFSASLGYDLLKNWRGTLSYAFTNVDSNFLAQEYQKNVVVLGLTWNF